MSISIATWNVNSIGARIESVTRWLESRQPDIVCLQEIKCVDEKFPVTEFELLGYQGLIFGQPTYNGVAILYRNELADKVDGMVQRNFPGDGEDAQRRLISASIAGIQVVNVYVPNGQAVGSDKYAFKLEWFGKLKTFFESTYDPAKPLVLCGDFNVAPHPIDVHDPAAWEGKVLFSVPERDALRHVTEWGLVDTFRELNPDLVAYSWWDYRQAAFRRNMGLRIDQIWASAPLAQTCLDARIDVEPRTWDRPSDHTPVVAVFNV